MSQSRPHSRSQPEVQRPSTSPNAVDFARRLATSPSNDTAQSNPPVNQDNAEAAEPREASQNAPVAEILQVFHVAYLILPILVSYPCLLLCYSLLLSPYFWPTRRFIAWPAMAARLLQIVLGNFLATFCVWSNFIREQQLQAIFRRKSIIIGNFQ